MFRNSIWCICFLVQTVSAQSFFDDRSNLMGISVVSNSLDSFQEISFINPAGTASSSMFGAAMSMQQRFSLHELTDVSFIFRMNKNEVGGIVLGWDRRGSSMFTSDRWLVQFQKMVGSNSSVGIGVAGLRPAVSEKKSWQFGAIEFGMISKISKQTTLGFQFQSAFQSWTEFNWQDPGKWKLSLGLGQAWMSNCWSGIQLDKRPGERTIIRFETRYSPTTTVQFNTGIGVGWASWIGMRFLQRKHAWKIQGMMHPVLGWTVHLEWGFQKK